MFCLNQRLLNNRILEGRTHYFFSGSCILTTSIPSPFILMDRSYLIKNPARQEACPQPQLLSQPFPVRKAESLRRSTILLPVLPEAHSGDGRDYTSFFRTRTGFLPTSLPPSSPSFSAWSLSSPSNGFPALKMRNPRGTGSASKRGEAWNQLLWEVVGMGVYFHVNLQRKKHVPLSEESGKASGRRGHQLWGWVGISRGEGLA